MKWRGLVAEARRYLIYADMGIITSDESIQVIRELVAHFDKYGHADRAAHDQAVLQKQIDDLRIQLDAANEKLKQIPHLESLIEGLEHRVSEANARVRLVEHTNIQLEQSLTPTAQRQTPSVRPKK